MDDGRPVLIGVGRLTHRDANISLRDIIAQSIELAAADAAQSESAVTPAAILDQVDAVACPGTFFTRSADIVCAKSGLPRVYPNLPASVAKAAGANRAKKFFYTFESGSSPQSFVNVFAERIATGQDAVVVVAGGEVLVTAKKLGALGTRVRPEDRDEVYKMLESWRDEVPDAGPPTMLAVEPEIMKAMAADPLEKAAGVALPIAGYPLLEQALRGHLQHSIDQHLDYVAKICEGMTEVAASPENAQHAWFPERQDACTIKTPTEDNRWVGFPYTKKMNSMLFVDQSAACILTSAGQARKFGIPDEQLVYLHGCGDAYEPQPPLRRRHLHRSEAVRIAGDRAFTMANVQPADITYVDLYACFPVAPQIAARELGLPSDDGTKMTLTGGLMYNGGPGANTAMHGLAALVPKLRSDPGSIGLIYANGGMMTKHSIGIYSTTPFPTNDQMWAREDPVITQRALNTISEVAVAEVPSGLGKVESYTVLHAKSTPRTIAVIGYLLDGPDEGKRFIANMRVNDENLRIAFHEDLLGKVGRVMPPPSTTDRAATFELCDNTYAKKWRMKL